MKKITVVITGPKQIVIDYEGFVGGECHEEAKKLMAQLEKCGIKIAVRQCEEKPQDGSTNSNEQGNPERVRE